MKKAIVLLIAVTTLFSCGLPAPKEQAITELGISISFPGDKKPNVIPASEYAKASASFYIGKSRFEIREIEEKAMPTDLAMLEEAIKADTKFKALSDKKTLPNGAFGEVYETTKGKSFLFYYKSATRFYRIIPVFNEEGKYYNEAITAIGTIK